MQPQPGNADTGAWTPDGDGWTWVWGATPDPELANLWGNTALTDVRQDPTGERNSGSWRPTRGGFQWRWGREPEEWSLNGYSYEELTNPDTMPAGRTPNGVSFTRPPRPDVVPPTVTNAWGDNPPSITGQLPEAESDGGGTPEALTEPPAHPMFTVSPGSLRDAEIAVLGLLDGAIGSYEATRAAVNLSRTQDVYTRDNREELLSGQDNLLLGIADTLRLVGEFVSRLNIAAQSYARADIDSFMPDNVIAAEPSTPAGHR